MISGVSFGKESIKHITLLIFIKVIYYSCFTFGFKNQLSAIKHLEHEDLRQILSSGLLIYTQMQSKMQWMDYEMLY